MKIWIVDTRNGPQYVTEQQVADDPGLGQSGTFALWDQVSNGCYRPVVTGGKDFFPATSGLDELTSIIVDSVSYVVRAGKTAINGVEYAVKNGKLVLGVAQDHVLSAAETAAKEAVDGAIKALEATDKYLKRNLCSFTGTASTTIAFGVGTTYGAKTATVATIASSIGVTAGATATGIGVAIAVGIAAYCLLTPDPGSGSDGSGSDGSGSDDSGSDDSDGSSEVVPEDIPLSQWLRWNRSGHTLTYENGTGCVYLANGMATERPMYRCPASRVNNLYGHYS